MMQTYTTRHTYQQWPDLPDPFGRDRWSDRDFASGIDAYRVADAVRSTCPNGMGWGLLGEKASIGVAFWRVGSIWDEYVETILPRRRVSNGTGSDASEVLAQARNVTTETTFATS